MNDLKPPKRKGLIYTLLTDVLFTLLALFMLLVHSSTKSLAIAEAEASKVPGLQDEVTGIAGALKDAQEDLINAQRKGHRYAQHIKGQNKTIGGLKDAVGKERDARQVAESRLRSGDPVTLVIMPDVTGSMTEPIEELRSGMASIFEVMPNISKDFRVGILAFRQGVVARFPVTPILPTYEDKGQSQASVLAFLDSLQAEQGFTEHLPVFLEATAMLRKAHSKADPKRKERLILLGDIGPVELDGKQGYSSEERVVKARILEGMKNWTAKGNRAVVALYAESEHTKQDPAAAESKAWFEALGSVSPQSAFYTHTSDLLRAINHAARE